MENNVALITYNTATSGWAKHKRRRKFPVFEDSSLLRFDTVSNGK
jgi:hypothetical protein